MPNIASALKEEITRLAKKETKALTKSLVKTSAQFRRDIAEVKRGNAKAKAEIVRLTRQLNTSRSAPATAESDTLKARFSSKSVKAQRARLGLSAADFGKLINVSSQTVYMWCSSGPRF